MPTSQSLGRIIIDLPGQTLTDEDKELLRHPHVGGVIFFTRNFASIEQLQALVASIRSVRSELILTVDQEGGRVQRFKEPLTVLPAVGKLKIFYRQNAEMAIKLAESMGWLMASEILSLDIDISFAPVLDLNLGLSEIIGDRAFGDSPEEVCALAGGYIQGMRGACMSTVGKHFPGHGGVTLDSHIGLPVDSRVYTDLEARDLLPFKKLLPQLSGIMIAHIVYDQIDSQPAGFSKVWLQKILRDQWCYDGVLFSDDLNMGGAQSGGDYLDRALLALEAGCDMLLICNNRPAAVEILEGLPADVSSLPQEQALRLRAAQGPRWQAFAGDQARLTVQKSLLEFERQMSSLP